MLITDDQFHVGTILSAFEHQRRKLICLGFGTPGAFAGFTELDTRPAVVAGLDNGTRVVVVTSTMSTSASHSRVHLVAREAGRDGQMLVEGQGVCIHPPVD